MTKTEIIAKLIESLSGQREELNREIRNIDFSKFNDPQVQSCLQSEIGNIDMQITNHLMQLQ